jgi:hypothetical protein
MILIADESKLKRKVAIGAALVVLSALGSAAAPVAADPVNVFSGNWTTTLRPPASGGSLGGTLDLKVATDGGAELSGLGGSACAPPTTYYSGTISIPGYPGVFAGCTSASPGHLVGRFGSDVHTGVGDIDITFAAPNTFSGHLTYGGTSYLYSGTLPAGGPSPTPPPTGPPSTTPPPGSSPTPSGTPGSAGPTGSSPSTTTGPSSTSGTALSGQSGLAALPGNGVVLVAEPVPGVSVTLASPNPLSGLPTAAFKVADSLGDFPGSTLVAPGELRTQPSGAMAACWLIGPDALQIPPSVYDKSVERKYFFGRLNASQAYTSCAAVARSIAAAGAAHPTATAANAPVGGCAARRFEVAVRSAKGLVTDARPILGHGPGPSSVRYACQRAGDGSLKITLSSHRKGGLRAALGDQLRLGVVRALSANARKATLAFSFGASWPGTWHTTRGLMHLAQTDAHLTGTYAACGAKATVAGDVTGSVFNGTWSEPCKSRGGRLRFTLAADGQAFRGSWSNGGTPQMLSWNGKR